METIGIAVSDLYRRVTVAATSRFLQAARHPYAFVPFTLLAAADSVMPLVPAEVMAITLMVLQPRRAQVIGAGFAFAAATSAFVFSLLVTQARAYVLAANPDIADVLENSSVFIADWGAPALAALSIFPDSPRASVAAATVGGLTPLTIACSVLIGKLVLYAGLVYAVRNLPQLIARLRKTSSPTAWRLYPRLRRLAAFQRLLQRDKR